MADSEGNSIHGQPTRSRGKHGILLILCFGQTIALVVLAAAYGILWTSVHPPPRTRAIAANREPFFKGNPGPWGNPEYARINIEPPDEFVPADDRLFEPTEWFFENYDPARLASFFNQLELSPDERALLPGPEKWRTLTNGISLVPPPALILSMNPTARGKLYDLLAQDPRNDFHYWPYTFRTGAFNEWFDHTRLTPSTISLVKKLVYTRGNSMCFSDLPEVFPLVTNILERQALIKTLSRNASLLMKLRITPASDVATLTTYWSAPGRKKDIRPLLESLTSVPDGIAVDVAHLLPSFARKRLNTYPSPPAQDEPVPDCFWTAFNFFNDPPDNRYHDDAVWRKELQESYAEVSKPGYGDLIFLLRPDGSPIHCAVYVADDVVFTKNGGNLRQPWILMKLADMLARYPQSYAVRQVFYHSKNRPGPGDSSL